MAAELSLPALDKQSWLLAPGPGDDVAVSTRIRLARNIQGFPFRVRMEAEQGRSLEDFLSRQLLKIPLEGKLPGSGVRGKLTYYALADVDELHLRLLFERHLISMEHVKGQGPRGVAFSDSGDVSIMVNEEDHLRIQVMASGFCTEELYEKIDALDDLLDGHVPYSFHPRFGFLTSCPTNVGTGMRASVMLHLPALVISKHIEKVFNAVSKMSLAARGCFGEGTEPLGDLFQISNQITLGKTPQDILVDVKKAIPRIVDYEREVRRILLTDEKKVLEDKVWRAYGTLTHARSISSEETFHALSHVRMGVHLGIFKEIPLELVNELMVVTQPAHLQKLLGRELKPEERDVERAATIRQRLAGK
ncbi:MAG: protein arginine kinase [Planctomycetota bacterium]